MSALSRLRRAESGGVAIEYSLIAALIAAVLIGALTGVGSMLSGKLGDLAASTSGPTP